MKTRGMYVLNGPIFCEPVPNREAEKATRLTERERNTRVKVTYVPVTVSIMRLFPVQQTFCFSLQDLHLVFCDVCPTFNGD